MILEANPIGECPDFNWKHPLNSGIKMSKEDKKIRKQERALRLKTFRKEKKRKKLTQEFKLISKEERDHIQLEKEKKLDFLRSCVGRGQRLCIELGFNIGHNDREMHSLCRQLGQAYNALKQATLPTSLHITSLSGNMATLLKSQGVENWVASLYEQSVWDVFAADQLILLSPDATEVLQEIQSDKVYVIGGIVDRSVRKAITLNSGSEHGVKTVRLPIQEHVPDRQSHVLNIDTTVAILIRYMELGDWATVLREKLPLRRQVSGGKAARKRKAAAVAAEQDGKEEEDEKVEVEAEEEVEEKEEEEEEEVVVEVEVGEQALGADTSVASPSLSSV